MTLQIIRHQPEPLHQREQHHDGAGKRSVFRRPSANRALANVEEARGAELGQVEAFQRCAELIGAHASGQFGGKASSGLCIKGEQRRGAHLRCLGQLRLKRGEHVGFELALSFGHFDLQRASVPFRTIRSKRPNWPVVKPAFQACA